ncbi:MAG: hypothetical protein LBI43_07365 [Streptococcaceae bacterium]|jgi:hypothetical protein|nr:hypothetical protein [Streptococcaceae bacterium]
MAKVTEFKLGLISQWLKGSVSVDSRFVKMDTQNVFLGLIPIGHNNQNMPAAHVSGAQVSTSLKMESIIVGIIFAIIGLSLFKSNFLGGLILLLIGVYLFLAGILTRLIFERDSGKSEVLFVPFFERGKMNSIANDVNAMLTYAEDKNDLNLFMDKKNEKQDI